MSSEHPLPLPPTGTQQISQMQRPQLQQTPSQRQRSKSNFSFRSDRSHKSSGTTEKADGNETASEKNARRLTTKANPNMAVSEEEPASVQSREETRLAPLRAIEHRDKLGNAIAEPDRSNPTRSRWERPLDTVRSFEAAINTSYSRNSYMRPDLGDSASMMGGGGTRRSSYMGGSHSHGRLPHDSYYSPGGAAGMRTSMYSQRPESFYGGGGGGISRIDSYYDGANNNINHSVVGGGNFSGPGPSGPGFGPGGPVSRARFPRSGSEPMMSMMNNNNNSNNINNNNGGGMQGGVYPSYGHQASSYETVGTASGSGSSADPIGYQTDPSSDNSSVDRIHAGAAAAAAAAAAHKHDGGLNEYGGGGGGQDAMHYPPNPPPHQVVPGGYGAANQYGAAAARGQYQYGGQNGNGGDYYPGGGGGGAGAPPSLPRKNVSAAAAGPPRVPIKLGGSSGAAAPSSAEELRPAVEKRKSWLSRRFSRSSRA